MKKLLQWPVLWWLRFWARLAFARINPFIIGVTGSAGKSSAVSAIATVARLKFQRIKVAEKANSESGIPADMLGLHFGQSASIFLDWIRICLLAPLRALPSTFSLPPAAPVRSSGGRGHPSSFYFDCYIVEMGIDEPTPPKNMGYLLTIVQPQVGIVLNALPVHAEQFERSDLVKQGQTLIEAIAAEKGKLVTQNQKLEYAILNADQPEIASLRPGNSAKTVTFGEKERADIRVSSVISNLNGTSMELIIRKRSDLIRSDLLKLHFPNLALPEFYGYTIAAALAVAEALHVNVKMAGEAIAKEFMLPPGRGQLFEGINDTIIIDSSYNASRATMIGSLQLLASLAQKRKALAVLGDMRELGNQAKAEHELVAKELLKTADQAILVGPLMKHYVLPILKRQHYPVEWFQTAGEAARFLKSRGGLQGGEGILIKGSQNTIFLEIVVEALLKNSLDTSKLCRRGAFWDRQRKPYE